MPSLVLMPPTAITTPTITATAAAGLGGMLVFEGEAGVGKTALIAAAITLASECGLRVLAARGAQLERDFAYGVVRQLFETELATASASVRRALLKGSAALAAPALGLAEPPDEAEARGPDPAFAARHGLYWLTANMTSRQTLLL